VNTTRSGEDLGLPAMNLPSLSTANRRTLEAVFRHPVSQNLGWRDLLALVAEVGHIHQTGNGDFTVEIAGQRHVMRKPPTKDLADTEVRTVRHFLERAGLTPGLAVRQLVADPGRLAPNLLIVVDHHEAKIFHVDVTSDGAPVNVIRPDDPYHALDHIGHWDGSRDVGRTISVERAYDEAIANAAAFGGRLVIVGHGTGKSNAAHHLISFLKNHHEDTYRRIVRELDVDLSCMTAPQLLDLAREVLSA
jgi:hypothetical protein